MSRVIKGLGYITILICDECSEEIQVTDDSMSPIPAGWHVISLQKIVIGQSKQSDEYKGYFCPECAGKSDISKLAASAGLSAHALEQDNS